ncbi:hypothetical protein [uncultured Arthrobacter sp.]|uniref:hypothetical protein n=1 Tax=uncultured Arthrobacter sp. TaxID=114050 RepID=UPI0025E9F9FE|nr:hypothetical protein [uncultured Arthrobacter sp.]
MADMGSVLSAVDEYGDQRFAEGAASRQAEVDALEARVAEYDAHMAEAHPVTPPPDPEPDPEPTPDPEPEPPTSGRPFIPYTADSYHKSTVEGLGIDTAKTSAFRSFMGTHPDQRAYAYPIIKGVDGNLWGSAYAEGKASDPVWKVRNINGAKNAQNAVLQTKGFHAPQWFGDSLTGTSDSPGGVMDMASGFTVFITKASRVPGTFLVDVESAGITWHSSNGLDYRNPKSNDKRNFTSRGRISDAMWIRRDLMEHAIANNTDLGHVLHFFICESLTTSGYTHPMTGTESAKNGWGTEGERLAIRADLDLTTRGLSPAGLVIARTLQRRGMYVGDNAGGESTLKAEQESAGRPVWGNLLNANSLRGITWADFIVLQRGGQ